MSEASTDAPGARGARSFDTALLHPRHWGSWLGVAVLGLLARVPRPVARALGRLMGWLAWHTSPRRRHLARVNLRLCFPEWDEVRRERVLRAHFRIAGQCLVDYPVLWFGGRQRHRRLIRLDDRGGVLERQRRGEPVIVCAAHAPALDFGGLRLSLEVGGVSFAKPMKNPVVDWINTRSRCQYGAIVFARHEGLRPAIRHLQRGRLFYYLGDEDLGPAHTVFAPFFGVAKATVPALGRLARLGEAPVIPAMGRYHPGEDRYELRMGQPLADFPTGEPVADAARMNAALEALIREDPAQYLWTLRFFKTRPPGEAKVY
ncbi:MAG: lipid A biosynthesis acyltransferase [Ectothiorhodospira sp.]